MADLLFGKRDASAAPVRMIGFPTDGGLATAGVTNLTMLGLSSVWRCLDILTNGVSQLDWKEVRGNLEMPISRIVNRPHPAMTRRDWTSYVVANIALYDRAYLMPTGGFDSEGVPMNLMPLDTNAVTPTTQNTIQFYTPLPADEFWVMATRVPRDRLVILNRGPLPGVTEWSMGIIKLARIKFAEALAADGYSSRYWQAGGPVDRALETDAVLPEAIAEGISNRWSARRAQGPDYWPVLSGGLKAKQYGIDPTAQAAVEARRELVADIGRYFGIPTRILNAPTGDSETYHTSEAGNQDLVRYTLQNYIGAVQDAISDLLPGGRRMVMDVDPLTRGVQLNRFQAYQFALGSKAWLTPDDVREMEGFGPVEDPNLLNPPAPVPVIAGPPAGGNPNGG